MTVVTAASVCTHTCKHSHIYHSTDGPGSSPPGMLAQKSMFLLSRLGICRRPNPDAMVFGGDVDGDYTVSLQENIHSIAVLLSHCAL